MYILLVYRMLFYIVCFMWKNWLLSLDYFGIKQTYCDSIESASDKKKMWNVRRIKWKNNKNATDLIELTFLVEYLCTQVQETIYESDSTVNKAFANHFQSLSIKCCRILYKRHLFFIYIYCKNNSYLAGGNSKLIHYLRYKNCSVSNYTVLRLIK